MKHFLTRTSVVWIAILLLCSACKKSTTAICDDSTSSLYKMADFRVGVAADAFTLQTNAAYRNIVINQYNVILPENAFLIYKVHPQQDVFDFTDYDYLAGFCKQYNKHLEGANLIWHLYLPDWINNFEGSEQDWENLAKTHIQTLVSRYKGVAESWMVVNEALNEDGTLKNTIWRQHIGDHYIEKFFAWAHEANPDALLFYNDYDMENNVQKLDAALNLADIIRGKGLRIDGIGLQMHNEIQFPTADEVSKATWKVANRNYKVYYSEWDISCNIFKNKTSLTDDMKQQQRYLINEMVKGYRKLPERNQYGITFWGVSDGDSWIRRSFNRIDWPLMYDDDYKAKPGYCGFRDALN